MFKKTEESICEVLKKQTKKFISIRLYKQLYSSFCVPPHPLWTRRSVPVLECQTLLVRNKHKRDDQTEQLIHPPTHTNLYTPLTHSQEITGCLAFVSFHFLKACLPAFLSVHQKHELDLNQTAENTLNAPMAPLRMWKRNYTQIV